MTIKKKVMLFTLFAFLILIGGCQTIKKSWNAAGDSVKEADQWIRDNLW